MSFEKESKWQITVEKKRFNWTCILTPYKRQLFWTLVWRYQEWCGVQKNKKIALNIVLAMIAGPYQGIHIGLQNPLLFRIKTHNRDVWWYRWEVSKKKKENSLRYSKFFSKIYTQQGWVWIIIQKGTEIISHPVLVLFHLLLNLLKNCFAFLF